MKCIKCGHDHKENIKKNIEYISSKRNEIGYLVKDDIDSIASELHLSDRQVKKYLALIKKYGADELIRRVQFGESVNSLSKTLSREQTVLLKAHKLISKEYNIGYSELRDLLKSYGK